MPIIGIPTAAIVNQADLLDVVMIELGERLYSDMTIEDDAKRAADKAFALRRDEVLSAHSWNGCVGYTPLTASGGTPATSWKGWTSEYLYPADCLRVLSLTSSERAKWEVGWSPTPINKKVLWAQSDNEGVRYIFRNGNVGTYSPYLAAAIIERMVVELCWALTSHRDRYADVAQQYLVDLAQYKLWDAQEQSIEEYRSTGLTDDVRNGG